MDLSIKVTTNSDCSVDILDTTEYSTATTIQKYSFSYADTVSIDVLQWNAIDDTTFDNPVYTEHSDQDTAITLSVSKDGWFTVLHYVLPSKDWFDNATDYELALYSAVYYTDGSSIYSYIDGITSEITIDDLIEVNTDDTTISVTSKDYVSICYLKQCYINYCLSIFNNTAFTTCWNNNSTDEDSYARDLVWMAINVIKYLVKCNQLYEAERIIEIMNSCNGLCPSSTSSSTSGCGCSKS